MKSYKKFILIDYILKFFLRWHQNRRFLCPKLQNFKRKSISPKSSVIYDICRVLTIKINLHPPGTPKPSKNVFLLQQDGFLRGFGVPDGYKSILIAKTLHISYITELFGLMDFLLKFWSLGHKNRRFWRHLKKILIYTLWSKWKNEMYHYFLIGFCIV